MTPRDLSSSHTFLVKFIVPACFILGFGIGALSLFFVTTTKDGAAVPELMRWLFVAIWLTCSVLLWRNCTVLKRVRADEDSLYISDFAREITVPLNDVALVSMSRWAKRSPVTLYFTMETPFGKSIAFLPESKEVAFWRSHPGIDALRAFVRG